MRPVFNAAKCRWVEVPEVEAKQRELAGTTEKCECVLAVNARRSTGLDSIELADPGCSACGGLGWRRPDK